MTTLVDGTRVGVEDTSTFADEENATIEGTERLDDVGKTTTEGVSTSFVGHVVRTARYVVASEA